jgi:hypothetical protein
MSKITFVTGDVLRPQRLSNDGWCLIAQVVNNVGAFGAGLAAQTAKQYPEIKKHYRSWVGSSTFKLGAVELCLLDREKPFDKSRKLAFALLCAQDGLPGNDNPQPIRYSMLAECIRKLGYFAKELPAEVHMPRLGCGLGRANWSLVQPFVEAFIPIEVPVFVYDLPGKVK